ncbi:DNA mismatch repair protein MutS [Halomarina oriensis]|uniref:DNA mismatch repair protein MutS n=1 Tax=Halomarina oriensis TaxID=671145 RepID=A0A6B0GPN6_9EURY|nr:DNA mismatch repair protein MutS [Halomarina oriensis]MWG36804.1 DNA mismatch repair protein MutS [Halomarina oriensis]
MEATGPPAKMVERREELTPMLSQYFDLTREYDDALVLFQVGDFYETFCEAAEAAARTLEITLTQREDSTGTYPMAGVPIDNVAPYVETLLDAGYRVAIADQVQDPSEASGVVDRAVTRVVTPGTVVDEELLGAGNTYTAALVPCEAERREDAPDHRDRFAVAFVDVSTGEFRVTSGPRDVVQDELDRLAPAEVVTARQPTNANADGETESDGDTAPHEFAVRGMHTPFRESAFETDTARETLSGYVPTPEALFETDAELRVAGGLLAYAEYTQGVDAGGLEYISRVRRYDPREGMRVDATALRSLEVFENREGGDEHTLLGVLDTTSCALGRRELTHWLRRPLLDRERIEARQDAVAELADRAFVREEARDLLRDVYDIERLVTRVARGRANARDLRALKSTLDVVPELKAVLADCEAASVRERRAALDDLADVRGLIGRAIVEEPPIEITEGGVVADGHDDDLDELRATEREGREWVADLEASERERTGIDSLKVGYNEVHGYYIEVTNPNLEKVPDDYTRRQTLKNSERFYTPELKRREDEILGASERADTREYQLFTDVRAEVGGEAERIQRVASVLAELDVLCTLADVAVERDYTRPELDGDGIHVEGGRHPVVETTEPRFVPNDADLRERNVAVITGPNMSGKSTYMRQVALIQLLAQVGSFVPAKSARLPVVDRVFTRVGASDDIAGGASTFMREMRELTSILHDATADSLVLLDEVGRGTSTADGRAIAWAVTEFLHDEVGATTLFATHYHELTRVADSRERVQNLHFTIDRSGDAVTFLHSVVEGASEASYGVEVAKLAGVPGTVIDRSRGLLDDGLPGGGERGHAPTPTPETRPEPRTNGHEESTEVTPPAEDTSSDDPLEAALRDLNIASMTPIEALTWLHERQQEVER